MHDISRLPSYPFSISLQNVRKLHRTVNITIKTQLSYFEFLASWRAGITPVITASYRNTSRLHSDVWFTPRVFNLRTRHRPLTISTKVLHPLQLQDASFGEDKVPGDRESHILWLLISLRCGSMTQVFDLAPVGVSRHHPCSCGTFIKLHCSCMSNLVRELCVWLIIMIITWQYSPRIRFA